MIHTLSKIGWEGGRSTSIWIMSLNTVLFQSNPQLKTKISKDNWVKEISYPNYLLLYNMFVQKFCKQYQNHKISFLSQCLSPKNCRFKKILGQNLSVLTSFGSKHICSKIMQGPKDLDKKILVPNKFCPAPPVKIVAHVFVLASAFFHFQILY